MKKADAGKKPETTKKKLGPFEFRMVTPPKVGHAFAHGE